MPDATGPCRRALRVQRQQRGDRRADRVQLPAKAALHQAQVDIDKNLVVANTVRVLQQIGLGLGNDVNSKLWLDGILVPNLYLAGPAAGSGLVQRQLIKPGMIGEVGCMAKPWRVIPMEIAEVQALIAAGQFRPTDLLVDLDQLRPGGTISVTIEPLFEGALDGLQHGATCIANACTRNHDRLKDPELGSLHRFRMRAVDTVGLALAQFLRILEKLLPGQTLVMKGH